MVDTINIIDKEKKIEIENRKLGVYFIQEAGFKLDL